MTMFNQSISPNGQPAFPPLKGSTTQDACQLVRMALPSSHGTSSSLKVSGSTKKASVAITNGVSDAGTRMAADRQNDILDGSINNNNNNNIRNLSHLLKNERQPAVRSEKCTISVGGGSKFQPFAPSSAHALAENDKLGILVGEGAGRNSFNPRDAVLLVSVSSAVKLDDEQIDLISEKMQRLTGFRKLKIENTVDPSLIAGFVISYCNDGSHVIDLSVKGQLATLAERLESADQKKSADHVRGWSSPRNIT